MTYQENDVVQYGKWAPQSDAIIERCDRGVCYIKAFRHWTTSQQGKWVGHSGRIDTYGGIRPHPRADKVWAEYCAWRLTNA